MDSSSTKDGGEAGLIIESPQGEMQKHALKFMFRASNNEVKFETLIEGIELSSTAGQIQLGHTQTPASSQLAQ